MPEKYPIQIYQEDLDWLKARTTPRNTHKRQVVSMADVLHMLIIENEKYNALRHKCLLEEQERERIMPC